MIEKICKRYHKLPSEVLEEDIHWINVMTAVMVSEKQRKEMEIRRKELSMKAKQNGII